MTSEKNLLSAQAKALEIIRTWRTVEVFPDGTRATCYHCHSTDIRVRPDCNTEWACADCGFSCTSPFLDFGQVRTCSCGEPIEHIPFTTIEECPACHGPIDPPI